MRSCRGCGTPATDDARECPRCGASISGWWGRLVALFGGALPPGPEVRTEADARPETAAAPFLMVVEDVFSIRGRGTVVTGRVQAGRVAVGQRVTLRPPSGERLVREVAGIEMFRKITDEARAGDNVGLLFSGDVRGEDVPRGTRIEATGG